MLLPELIVKIVNFSLLQVMITVDDSDKETVIDQKGSSRPMNYTVEGWIAIFTPTASKFREKQSLAACKYDKVNRSCMP